MPDDDPSTQPGPPEPAAWRPWVPPGAEPPVAPTADLPAAPPPRRSRRPMVMVGAGALVLAGVVAAVWIGVVQPGRGQRAPRPDAAGTTATQAAAGSGAGGGERLRAPDTLGGMQPVGAGLDSLVPPPGPEGGQLTSAAYAAPDGRTGVMLLAYRVGLEIETPEELARFWASGLGAESDVQFEPFPRGGLAIRCARPPGMERGIDAAVCFVDGPDVAVVLSGSLSEAATADLVAEAHRKLTA